MKKKKRNLPYGERYPYTYYTGNKDLTNIELQYHSGPLAPAARYEYTIEEKEHGFIELMWHDGPKILIEPETGLLMWWNNDNLEEKYEEFMILKVSKEEARKLQNDKWNSPKFGKFIRGLFKREIKMYRMDFDPGDKLIETEFEKAIPYNKDK